MAHHHVTDFDKPDDFDKETRREVLAEVRQKVKDATDRQGLVATAEVLDFLDEAEEGGA